MRASRCRSTTAASLFDKQSRRVFTNWSTDEWYPRTGTNNFATYDVTLRWPKKLDMIGSGVRTEYGDTEDGRWERRVLDAPSRFFVVDVGWSRPVPRTTTGK